MEKNISRELADIVKEVSEELSESLMIAIYEKKIIRLIEKEFGLDLKNIMIIKEPKLPGGFNPDLVIMSKDMAIVIEVKAVLSSSKNYIDAIYIY